MEMCYNHVFAYVEFEIIHTFLKGRRSKYKPAYALVLSAQLLFFLVASEHTATGMFAGRSTSEWRQHIRHLNMGEET